jgi:6-phosphogluconate dehydrogenase
MMPGGSRAGWEVLKPILEPVAAVARAPPGHTPHPGRKDELCVCYIGGGGSGHYVKMVHNGIEYGDMQLIAEVPLP